MDELKVADVMNDEVVTLTRNEELALADQIMSIGRIRHLPVVDDDDGQLVGVVSQRDLFYSALVKALGHGTMAKDRMLGVIKVKEVMQAPVQTTSPSTPIREAAAMMVADKIGCLPVLDGDRIVGILTESDFVALHAKPPA